MCLFLFPSDHDFHFPSHVELCCSALCCLRFCLSTREPAFTCRLHWAGKLFPFLKIAAEDRRSHPWQCAKRRQCWSFSGSQGHLSRLLFIPQASSALVPTENSSTSLETQVAAHMATALLRGSHKFITAPKNVFSSHCLCHLNVRSVLLCLQGKFRG